MSVFDEDNYLEEQVIDHISKDCSFPVQNFLERMISTDVLERVPIEINHTSFHEYGFLREKETGFFLHYTAYNNGLNYDESENLVARTPRKYGRIMKDREKLKEFAKSFERAFEEYLEPIE